jgi:hypothetical protein
MPQTLFPQSALSRANLTAERGEALQARSDMMELIAVTRHAIAQSRILIAEADSVITWRYPSLEHRRKVKEIPKETLSDRIQRISH